MKKYSSIISIIFLYLCCIWCVGCASGMENKKEAMDVSKNREWTEQNSQKEMIYAVNVDSSVNDLNFQNVWLNRSQFWGGLVFQGLLIADDNVSNVKPDLCEEYIISPDGKNYVFMLKDNVFWHDGEKLTVEDVVWSLECCMKSSYVNGYIQQGLQNIEGMDEFRKGKTERIRGISVEGNDITIQLVEKDSGFLSAIAQLAILPRHCLEEVPVEEIENSDFWKHPIGSGPYKVQVANDGKEAVLTANERYTGQIPKIERIRYKILENPETDEFDFTITSNAQTVNKFLDNKKYEVKQTNNLYYRYLMFNLDGRTGKRAKLLQKQEVRQALVMALDRNAILEKIYGEAAIFMNGGIPKSDSWYADKKPELVSYNPERARELLQEAEFDFNETVVLTRYHEDELSKKLLEEVAAYWNAVGVKTSIVPTSEKMTDKIWKETDWYDVGLKNLSAIDYTEWYYEYSSENQLWSVILNRKEFDPIVNELNKAAMAKEKIKLYSEIQAMETELVYKIPICILPQYVIYNKEHLEVPDLEFPNMWFYFDMNIADWEMKENRG